LFLLSAEIISNITIFLTVILRSRGTLRIHPGRSKKREGACISTGPAGLTLPAGPPQKLLRTRSAPLPVPPGMLREFRKQIFFLPFPLLKNPPVISFRLTTAAIALIFYRGTILNSGDDTTAGRSPGAGLKHDAVRCTWCLNSANVHGRTITTIQCPAGGRAESLTACQLQTGDYTDPQKKICIWKRRKA